MSDDYGYLRELRDSAIRGLARGEEKEARNGGPYGVVLSMTIFLYTAYFCLFIYLLVAVALNKP
jgi:hypothetical protein